MRHVFPNQRLFILAEPRSGSSWLMVTLGSHPEIQLSGKEIMNQTRNTAIKKYIGGNENDFHDCLDDLEKTLSGQFWKNFIQLRLKKKARFCGCKILLNQLTLISDKFPNYFLDFYKDAFFIFLYRTNIVAEEISLQLAHTYNIWHVKKEEKIALKKIHIYPSVFVSNLEKSLRRREKIWQLLSSKQLHFYPLSYEELFVQRENVLEKIFVFLGIAEKMVTFSKEVKGNPFLPQMVIENYQEVKSYLQQYPSFLNMLDDV